ncbi:MAG TPA: hypothetical protein DDZ65_12210, partial [Firmicutes bacterium]|nr:hypothetical protein [Bacillota bacterium]
EAVFRVVKASSRIIPQNRQGSNFLITLKVHASISEFNFARPKLTKKEMERLQEQAARFVKEECQQVLSSIQALHADVLLLGLSCHAKYGKDFSYVDWREKYGRG